MVFGDGPDWTETRQRTAWPCAAVLCALALVQIGLVLFHDWNEWGWMARIGYAVVLPVLAWIVLKRGEVLTTRKPMLAWKIAAWAVCAVAGVVMVGHAVAGERVMTLGLAFVSPMVLFLAFSPDQADMAADNPQLSQAADPLA
ncbi:MAG TPA: hypothetical protein VG839_03260 [Asticcacaulis sp.]|nr:hypothetical protein [Asticcacaulis sp.]